MSDARQTRYDCRRRSCRTNSEFDSIRGEYRFFECRKTGSQTESKNRFIRFFPYRYTTLKATLIIIGLKDFSPFSQIGQTKFQLSASPDIAYVGSKKKLAASVVNQVYRTLSRRCRQGDDGPTVLLGNLVAAG